MKPPPRQAHRSNGQNERAGSFLIGKFQPALKWNFEIHQRWRLLLVLHHLVGGLHGLGIHLIRALRENEVDHFLHDADVGQFERALLQLRQSRSGGIAQFRRAGRGGFLVKIVAHGIQSAGIDEPRQLDLKIRVAARRRVSRRAAGGDGDAGGAGGHGLKTALHGIAVAGDDAALRIRLERAVARVGERAVGHLHLKKAVALDRDVQVVAGLGQIALREQPFRGHRHRALADLQAGRQLVAAALLRAGFPRVLDRANPETGACSPCSRSCSRSPGCWR